MVKGYWYDKKTGDGYQTDARGKLQRVYDKTVERVAPEKYFIGGGLLLKLGKTALGWLAKDALSGGNTVNGFVDDVRTIPESGPAFSSRDLLEAHFEKHGTEFKGEYITLAL